MNQINPIASSNLSNIQQKVPTSIGWLGKHRVIVACAKAGVQAISVSAGLTILTVGYMAAPALCLGAVVFVFGAIANYRLDPERKVSIGGANPK
jgi:hypothetical protein